jgi:hypothetical protein
MPACPKKTSPMEKPSDVKSSAQPFPWRPLIIIYLVNISESVAITLLFPFAPTMVGGWVSMDEVGTWAGMLASAYSVAGMPASIWWGWLSDHYGRKPVLFATLLGTAVGLVAFGLSESLEWALCARAFGGLFSGIGGVCRAAIRDITALQHRSKAFSLVGWCWSMGFFVGPMVGGLLSQPALSRPWLRGTLFDSYPFLLPCAAAALINLGGALALTQLRLEAAAARGADAAGETGGTAPSASSCSGGGGGGSSSTRGGARFSSGTEMARPAENGGSATSAAHECASAAPDAAPAAAEDGEASLLPSRAAYVRLPRCGPRCVLCCTAGSGRRCLGAARKPVFLLILCNHICNHICNHTCNHICDHICDHICNHILTGVPSHPLSLPADVRRDGHVRALPSVCRRPPGTWGGGHLGRSQGRSQGRTQGRTHPAVTWA